MGYRFDRVTYIYYNSLMVDYKNKFNVGFTLAEVLITLGIIAVVAAMTIPLLVSSYQKEALATSLEKFYTTMYQATKRSEVDNGPVSSWNFGDGTADGTYDWFMTYIGPYLKYENVTKLGTSIWGSFSDGTRFRMFYSSPYMNIYYYTKSNVSTALGKNAFVFFLPTYYSRTFTNQQVFGPYDFGVSLPSRAGWKDNPTYGCNTSASKHYCAGLIMSDGWKISDDYPW